MKSFRERNPLIIGAVSLALIAIVTVGALNYQRLPFISDGKTYSAYFEEAGAHFESRYFVTLLWLPPAALPWAPLGRRPTVVLQQPPPSSESTPEAWEMSDSQTAGQGVDGPCGHPRGR